MNLLLMLRSRKNAVIQISTDAVINVSAVSGSLLLAQRFDGIGEWTRFQIFFMLGYAMLVNGILDSLFGYNIRMISRRVGRGQLDHLLLQPQPLWRAFVTEGFSPFSQPVVLAIALAFTSWSAINLPIHRSALWAGAVLLNLLGSCVIVLAFQLTWGSLAFWAPLSAEEINSATNRMVRQLGTFPLDAVQFALRALLLTVVPVGFTAWFPVRHLVGLDDLTISTLFTPLAAGVFLAVAVLIFRRGLVHYATVGSQRYSTFGHRR